MAEYQAGSVEAFDRLHDALAPALKAYLASLTRDSTRADDLLQGTFLQIHRARASHTPGEAVRPWVFAIAKRVFLMHVRGTKRRERREHQQSAARGSTSSASLSRQRGCRRPRIACTRAAASNPRCGRCRRTDAGRS